MRSIFQGMPKKSVIDVGWIFDPGREATFIWDAPHKLTRQRPRSEHAKSLTVCPAVNDHEARLYEVSCPIDVQLRLNRNARGEPFLSNVAGHQSTIRQPQLEKMIVMTHPSEWPHPERPIIQMMTPYLFVADEPVYLTQLPAFYHYGDKAFPGLTIGGRFPIHIWPRELTWAFEWHDPSRDIMLRRGDPLFYLQFEIVDPARRIRLIEAQMTPEVRGYAMGIRGVTNYVNRTFGLFGTAKSRRPRRILIPKKDAATSSR
jgi:hypothetical protein